MQLKPYKIITLFIILYSLFYVKNAYGQVSAGLLLGLTNASTNEINTLTGVSEGQMLYNYDTKTVMVFDGTNWVSTSNNNWLSTGNNISSGTFLGSTNDAFIDFKSNSTSVLQIGKRQTLGLTQNYPDYTDGNQYLTYLKGNNGVSALQFQADGASFYKPMFFTTADGNFRLKGSAAGTDFFEIGSNGVSNAGELEFVIADDGDEPFIFKRYDYRDQLKKELFRIQGSASSQNALPRVGINTGQMANSTLEVKGSVSNSINTTSGNLTLNETHHTIIVPNNSVITLPAASICNGRSYIIKNENNSSVSISTYINTQGNNTTAIAANSVLHVQSNGTNWHSLTPSKTKNTFFINYSGRAYFYVNRWYSTNYVYGTGYYLWNQYLGTSASPNYSTTNQSGVAISSAVNLSKVTIKSDFNAVPTNPIINFSIIRNNAIINIGDYAIANPSTSVTVQSIPINFQLEANDLLVWATRSSGGNRLNYISLTIEFSN